MGALHIIGMNEEQFRTFIALVGGNSKKPSTLKETTPSAWRVWRRQFAMIAQHRNWDDARMKLEAATAMEENAATITADIPHDNAEQTAEQYLTLLEARLG